MDLMDVIRDRRSIRRFSGKRVSREKLDRLVEAARQAPSSLNAQPWHFTVCAGSVRDKVVETVSKSTVYLQDVLNTMNGEERAIAERFIVDLGGAPVVIVVSMPAEDEIYNRLTMLLSVGCAMENLQLTATDMGLGSCNITFAFWVRDELADLLGLAGREIVSIIVVGYPDEEPAASPREEKVATYIGFEDS